MGIRSKSTVVSTALSIIILLFLTGSSTSISHHYVEDFSTKQYCDTLHTTAWWDTLSGELKLFPFVPTLAGTYNTPGTAWGVTVSEDNAFVADGSFGLQVIDISDPANPTLAGGRRDGAR